MIAFIFCALISTMYFNAFASSITIKNGGFEDDAPINAGEYKSGIEYNLTASWQFYENAFSMDYDNAFTTNPSTSTYFVDTNSAKEGDISLILSSTDINKNGNGYFGISQELEQNIIANKVYTLKAFIGNPGNGTLENEFDFSGFCGYRIEIMADNYVIAQDDNSLNIPEAHWNESIILFTSPVSNPCVDINGVDFNCIGQNLTVRLINLNYANAQFMDGNTVYFDDLRLEMTEVQSNGAVTIENYGFENAVLSDNSWEYNNVIAANEWQLYKSHSWLKVLAANPRGGDAISNGEGAKEGDNNLCIINTYTRVDNSVNYPPFGIMQDLNVQMAVNKSYTLKVYVARPDDNEYTTQSGYGWSGVHGYAWPGYRVELVAGDDSVVARDDNSLRLEIGQWFESVIHFDSPTQNPCLCVDGNLCNCVGENLKIRLLNLNNYALYGTRSWDYGSNVFFDDVRLSMSDIATNGNVYIENNGFEEDGPMSVNSYAYGNNALINGWEKFDDLLSMSTDNVIVMNPSQGTTFNDQNAIEGDVNIAILHTDENKNNDGTFGIFTNLNVPLLPDKTYTLSVFIGNPAYNEWSQHTTDGAVTRNFTGFPGYRIDLMAGDYIIAQDDNSLDIADGEWAESVFSFHSPSGNQCICINDEICPCLDQNLQIRLLNLNNASNGGTDFVDGNAVCFDDVRLEMSEPKITSNISAYCSSKLYLYFAADGVNFEFISEVAEQWDSELTADFDVTQSSKLRFICERDPNANDGSNYGFFVACVEYSKETYCTTTNDDGILNEPFEYIDSLTTNSAGYDNYDEEWWFDAYMGANIKRPVELILHSDENIVQNLTLDFAFNGLPISPIELPPEAPPENGLIYVNNAGFEDTQISDNQWEYNNVLGYSQWKTYNSHRWMRIFALNPKGGDSIVNNEGAKEGNTVVGIWNYYIHVDNNDDYGVWGIAQNVKVPVIANKTYTLKVAVSAPAPNEWNPASGWGVSGVDEYGWGGYQIELVAGDFVIAHDVNSLNIEPKGIWVESVISFTSPLSNPCIATNGTSFDCIGQEISIRLLNGNDWEDLGKYSFGEGTNVFYDDVRLEMSDSDYIPPTPPPTPPPINNVVLDGPLYINNAGFEDTQLVPNQWEYNNVMGKNRWRTYNACPWCRLFAVNPSDGTAIADNVGAYDGNTALCVHNYYWYADGKDVYIGGIMQDLNAPIIAEKTYTLKVAVGKPAPNVWNPSSGWGVSGVDSWGWPGYRIEIVAGDHIIARDDNSLNIESGHWSESELTVTIPSSNPCMCYDGSACDCIGEDLQIRLISLNNYALYGTGSFGLGSTVLYDDVRMDISTSTATHITVNNAGFENDQKAANEYQMSSLSDIIIASDGWKAYNLFNPIKQNVFITNPSGGTAITDGGAKEGNVNIGLVQLLSDSDADGTEFGVFQDTNVALEADKLYTLRVAVGNQAENTWNDGSFWDYSGWPGYRVDLSAGMNCVVATDNNSILIEDGHWNSSFVQFYSPSSNPCIDINGNECDCVGQNLMISLIHLNDVQNHGDDYFGVSSVVYFDDVRLEMTDFVSPTPTPAPTAIPAEDGPIYINNHGFEDTQLPINNWEYNGVTTISRWKKYNSNSYLQVYVANPAESDAFLHSDYDGSPEGNSTVCINIYHPHVDGRPELISGIYQDVQANIIANKTYTLKVHVGNPAGNVWASNSGNGVSGFDEYGWPGYQIQLVAGDHIIAMDDNSMEIKEGYWKESIMSLTMPASNPCLCADGSECDCIGEPIQIRLINLNNWALYGGEGPFGLGGNVWFDDVRLSTMQYSECSEFREHMNDCPQLADNWNLKISTGDSYWSGTTSRIMFSYIADGEFSDFYKLDNCDFNDFKGDCHNEYFIVPGLNDAISNANDVHFEIVDCGSDGIQIDEIAIGHDGAYGEIQLFPMNDGETVNCNLFTIYNNNHSIGVDGNGNCEWLTLHWLPGDNYANVHSALKSQRNYASICDDSVKDQCAGDDNQCEVPANTVTMTLADDGHCSRLSVSANSCPSISSSWNLGISTGKLGNIKDYDGPLMFAYCVGNVCSNWYKLDNCDWNDFNGFCLYEYFIIPGLNDAMSNVNVLDDVTFEFKNCGTDVIEIDHIQIGHNGQYAVIETYGNDAKTFKIKDSEIMSVKINDLSDSDATISYNLRTDITADICVDAGCAGTINQCKTRTYYEHCPTYFNPVTVDGFGNEMDGIYEFDGYINRHNKAPSWKKEGNINFYIYWHADYFRISNDATKSGSSANYNALCIAPAIENDGFRNPMNQDDGGDCTENQWFFTSVINGIWSSAYVDLNITMGECAEQSDGAMNVINGGFEQHQVCDNCYEFAEDIIVDEDIGWRYYDDVSAMGEWSVIAVNPFDSTAFDFAGGAPEGNVNLALSKYDWMQSNVNGNGRFGISQNLHMPIIANKVYTLRVFVGNPAENVYNQTTNGDDLHYLLNGFPSYRIDLMAGDHIIAQDDDSLDIADGQWKESVINFYSPSSANDLCLCADESECDCVGENIQIRLINLNINTQTPHANAVFFDDVRLEMSTPMIINNGGFEDDDQNNDFADAYYKYGGGSQLYSNNGWQMYNPNGVSFLGYAAKPKGGTSFVGDNDGAKEGNLNVGLAQSDQSKDKKGSFGITQNLKTALIENKLYTLKVFVGNPAKSIWSSPYVSNTEMEYSWPGYRIELLAGNHIIAVDDNSLNPSHGHWNESVISFTSPINSSQLCQCADGNECDCIGGDLQIRLLNLNDASNDIDGSFLDANVVFFDHVRLEQTAAKPVDDTISPSNIFAYCDSTLYLYYAENGKNFELIAHNTDYETEVIHELNVYQSSRLRFICEKDPNDSGFQFGWLLACVEYGTVKYCTQTDGKSGTQSGGTLQAPFEYIDSLTTNGGSHNESENYGHYDEKWWFDDFINSTNIPSDGVELIINKKADAQPNDLYNLTIDFVYEGLIRVPTIAPTLSPSVSPTLKPTKKPSFQPTLHPTTRRPTALGETLRPSVQPTIRQRDERDRDIDEDDDDRDIIDRDRDIDDRDLDVIDVNNRTLSPSVRPERPDPRMQFRRRDRMNRTQRIEFRTSATVVEVIVENEEETEFEAEYVEIDFMIDDFDAVDERRRLLSAHGEEIDLSEMDECYDPNYPQSVMGVENNECVFGDNLIAVVYDSEEEHWTSEGVWTVSATKTSVIGMTTHSGFYAAAQPLIIGYKKNKVAHFLVNLASIVLYLFMIFVIGISMFFDNFYICDSDKKMNIKSKKCMIFTLIFYVFHAIICIIYYGSDADATSAQIEWMMMFITAIPLVFHFWVFSIAAFSWFYLYSSTQVSTQKYDIFEYEKAFACVNITFTISILVISAALTGINAENSMNNTMKYLGLLQAIIIMTMTSMAYIASKALLSYSKTNSKKMGMKMDTFKLEKSAKLILINFISYAIFCTFSFFLRGFYDHYDAYLEGVNSLFYLFGVWIVLFILTNKRPNYNRVHAQSIAADRMRTGISVNADGIKHFDIEEEEEEEEDQDQDNNENDDGFKVSKVTVKQGKETWDAFEEISEISEVQDKNAEEIVHKYERSMSKKQVGADNEEGPPKAFGYPEKLDGDFEYPQIDLPKGKKKKKKKKKKRSEKANQILEIAQYDLGLDEDALKMIRKSVDYKIDRQWTIGNDE